MKCFQAYILPHLLLSIARRKIKQMFNQIFVNFYNECALQNSNHEINNMSVFDLLVYNHY